MWTVVFIVCELSFAESKTAISKD